MLEMLMSVGRKIGGVIKGDLTMGYYGVVEASKFITGDALASQIGLTAGTAQHSDAGWVKFAYYGKTLYVAKKPFRHSISWQMIYQAGAVYGDDTNGYIGSGSSKIQNARVTIGDKQYRVRLMYGSAANPAANNSIGRELKDLFVKIMAIKNGEWDSITDSDLGFSVDTLGPGNFNWLVEMPSGSPDFRMTFTKNPSTVSSQGASNANSYIGWRPVLELIE
jgi:hypothetical protein